MEERGVGKGKRVECSFQTSVDLYYRRLMLCRGHTCRCLWLPKKGQQFEQKIAHGMSSLQWLTGLTRSKLARGLLLLKDSNVVFSNALLHLWVAKSASSMGSCSRSCRQLIKLSSWNGTLQSHLEIKVFPQRSYPDQSWTSQHLIPHRQKRSYFKILARRGLMYWY